MSDGEKLRKDVFAKLREMASKFDVSIWTGRQKAKAQLNQEYGSLMVATSNAIPDKQDTFSVANMLKAIDSLKKPAKLIVDIESDFYNNNKHYYPHEFGSLSPGFYKPKAQAAQAAMSVRPPSQVTLREVNFSLGKYPSDLRGVGSFKWGGAYHVKGLNFGIKAMCLLMPEFQIASGMVAVVHSRDEGQPVTAFFFEEAADCDAFEKELKERGFDDGPLIPTPVVVPTLATVTATVLQSKHVSGMEVKPRDREHITIFARMLQAGVRGKWGATFSDATNLHVLSFSDEADAAQLVAMNKEEYAQVK